MAERFFAKLTKEEEDFQAALNAVLNARQKQADQQQRWPVTVKATVEPELTELERALGGRLFVRTPDGLVEVAPVVSEPPAPAKLSVKELADKYGVDYPALRGRLDRWRYKHDTGYVEVSNPKENEPKYLYDESDVMPVIEALKAKAGTRKRATDVQRKEL